MAKDGKSEPAERPEPCELLRKNLDKGLKDAEIRNKLSVELHIGGGMPAQGYRFLFRASGGGAVHSEIRCGLSGRERQTKEAFLNRKDWMKLLQTVLTSGVLDMPAEAPCFLPDTIVGYLEISDGKSKHRLYFAADEEQAKVQNKVPPPELLRVVGAIYELGNQLLDMPSVKP